MSRPIVIIGAGQGGLQAAESLRSAKYDGEILLIGDEPHAPYNRPPLSKAFLLGECDQEQLIIRQPAVFEKKNITLKTSVRVDQIDAKAQTVLCEDGMQIEYEKLILATGSRARKPPIKGTDGEGVHCIRTLDDTLQLAKEMDAVEDIVVIGGGFIGLEMAAVARKLGKKVTVVEFADRLMARVVSPMISQYYKDLHEKHGCTVLLNAAASEILLNGTKAKAVQLNSGEELKADMVVLGVGVFPNQELAQAAGLECDGGIIIDNKGRTSDAHIYALGDCTGQRREDGSLLRLESVQNAVEMAKACAADIVGLDKPFVAAPWFWSDQYDVKMQMVGLSQGYDQAVLRGDIQTGSFSYLYFKEGQLIAIDSLNQSGDHMAGRKLLAGVNGLTPTQAGDVGFALRDAAS
jgi:3-phenylpropionate/trans-cinnamate dioxygenase ferredoxin reductase component